MGYKVGDKVLIKSREELVREYGEVDRNNQINDDNFSICIDFDSDDEITGKIVTVSEYHDGSIDEILNCEYENDEYNIPIQMIKCLVNDTTSNAASVKSGRISLSMEV